MVATFQNGGLLVQLCGYNYPDHHEDPAATVDQGLPGDVGGLDPEQDQAGAPPAGQPHQGERCHNCQPESRQQRHQR